MYTQREREKLYSIAGANSRERERALNENYFFFLFEKKKNDIRIDSFWGGGGACSGARPIDESLFSMAILVRPCPPARFCTSLDE